MSGGGRPTLRTALTVLWLVNLLAAGVILSFLGFTRLADQAAAARPAPPGPPSTHTPFPAARARTARPTPIFTETRTPVPLFLPTFIAPAMNLDGAPGTSTVYGYSVEGRPLEVFTFGRGSTRRLIVAGIHGAYEGNTVELAYQLIDHLERHPEAVPEELTLYVIPNINPDGYARDEKGSPDGRANANNVDLNRNWPSRWTDTWDRTGCFDLRLLGAGAYAASEPETGYLMLFIQSQKPDALISYHSAALGIFAGGVPTLPAADDLARKAAAVSTYPYPGVDTGCVYTGNLADWAADQGIAAIDIELTDHTHTDYRMNMKILEVFLAWDHPEE